MNKTQAVFATFTARYGNPQLKEGQDMQAVAMSYENALSMYSLGDLNAACQSWMATSKYPRWAEPAELKEILRSFGAKPETTKTLDMAPRTREAANDASRWYQEMILRPLPDRAWPFTWADALADTIGVGKPQSRGKSFGWLLTRAWLDGVIPSGFDAKAVRYFAACHERKDAYLTAVRAHGALAVHEGRARLSISSTVGGT